MSIMSEEEKIIDLENEIIFLKDVLNEKQKEIEEKNVAINKMSKDISRQLKEIERLKINLKTKNNFDYFAHKQILEYGYISKDKIREIIEHYNNELEHIKNGEEFENEKPMYYWGKVALENLLEDN